MDNIDLSENAVLVYSNQTIANRVTFTQGFEVEGDLRVDGDIDSIDLVAFAAEVVLLSQEQVLSGAWIFTADFTVNGKFILPDQCSKVVCVILVIDFFLEI